MSIHRHSRARRIIEGPELAGGDIGADPLAAFLLALSLRASRRGPLIREAMRADIRDAITDLQKENDYA